MEERSIPLAVVSGEESQICTPDPYSVEEQLVLSGK
jgi:hypothetical protein